MERLKGEGVQDWLSQHLTAPWHGHQTVASELGNDIIANIKERWSQLDSSVRLGVLFSLISLKKAQQLQLRDKCQEMLKDYPTEGSLRFNVEQFADQAQLGSLMDGLTSHISRDGIKFHPKEFAYLNESVCRAGQGKDPKTKQYPPLTGPSLQQYFNLRDSHVSIHTERAEKLKKMAEQASPIVALAGGNMSSPVNSSGSAVASGSSPSNSPAAGVSVVGNGGNATIGAPVGSLPAPGAPGGPPGPPRPAKTSSTGLFVRKPAGSFLRNNPPRPMPLPRNPSTGQLPLRSPRLDGPTTPRLNQKSSRIQILDIQQGNEIMQSMNDEKKRKEQAEQREKELKKEQRALEQEAKRQQDAEKKAQVQKEREEKKREREEAKKIKEKQKQEREEQVQKEREQRQQRLEKEQEQQEQDRSKEARPLSNDDEGDDEASLSTLPARKRTRLVSSTSSRGESREDDDYDNGERPEGSNEGEPMSPVTPSLNHKYSNHGVRDDRRPTPAGHPSDGDHFHTDSYFPQQQSQDKQQQQQPPQQQPVSNILSDHPTIFQNINLLTEEDRAYIEAFLQGHPMKRPHENESLYQIVMNQEQVQDSSGRPMYETILIEMNFDTGEWKKIKRRRTKPHVPATAASAPQ
ncbi:hypothetical protein EDD11_006012 [Mortierella claussenii]|nr:hypothetical protein EDD11_006012 [Mortierella claussenii]